MRYTDAQWPARLRSKADLALAAGARVRGLPEFPDRLADQMARRPVAVVAALIGVNLGLAMCFAVAGRAAGDDALFFRELAPGTWLSFAQLLFIAAVAWAIHRESGALSWHQTFWGLSAAIFVVFAFDEITQSAIFLSHLLEDSFGLTATAGFHDLEAVLLTLGFAAAGLVLLPRAAVLRHHPTAVALLVLAGLLGAASQGLDSFAPATSSEFVAEETLKLLAEAVFAGAFLVVLRDVRSRGAKRPAG